MLPNLKKALDVLEVNRHIRISEGNVAFSKLRALVRDDELPLSDFASVRR